MKPLRILMVGFGNVGKRISHLLTDELQQYHGLKNLHFTFIGIFTKYHGYLYNTDGIDLSHALKEVGNTTLQVSDETILNAISKSNYDVLVELTTLNIQDSGEPAVSFVREALNNKKHVVTANKGPAAFAYKEISKLAAENKCHFFSESAVMDGTPIFSMARSGLLGAKVTAVSGILNTTTNFILSRMEEGVSLKEAVKEAQSFGFAEADPSNDIEGWDSAAKLSVLANILMEGSISPFDVVRKGIKEITPEQIQSAAIANKRIKLLCKAEKNDRIISASVQPEVLTSDHSFASVNGTDSIVKIETDLMGPIVIRQENPTLNDTAYGVLNDLMTIATE